MIITSIVVTLCGCASVPSHKLSKSQAIEIARRIAVQHGQDLQTFEKPRVFFEVCTKTWIVSYTERKPYQYEVADGFAVDIDDETRGINYYDHIWK